MNRFLFFVSILLLVSACRDASQQATGELLQDTEMIRYAKGFSMKKMNEGFLVTIFHPSDRHIPFQQILIDSNKKQTNSASKFDVRFTKPCQKITSQSTTNIAMLTAIGADSLLIAASNGKYIYNPVLQQRIQLGALVDLGSHETVALESLIELQPDVLFKYLYAGDNSGDERVVDVGIPVVYITDYLETHPLGRAEWIKLVGVLTGRLSVADSVFTLVEANYNGYKQLLADSKNNPTVMVGNSFKGIWYTPGGRSFLACILADAGANYFWKTDTTTGSLPLSIESIVERQSEADFWVNATANNIDELLSMDERYSIFKAMRNRQVYHYDNRINAFGGNDYFESAVVHPDVLLADYIQIFHPRLVDTTRSLYYLRKLNQVRN